MEPVKAEYDLNAIADSVKLEQGFQPGSLVCINDHIASFVPNPLIGQNDERLGERFVGMADAYDESLRGVAHQAAEELGIELKDGVYMQVTGPTFETPAEARAYASLGADVVGMSTACETIKVYCNWVRFSLHSFLATVTTLLITFKMFWRPPQNSSKHSASEMAASELRYAKIINMPISMEPGWLGAPNDRNITIRAMTATLSHDTSQLATKM